MRAAAIRLCLFLALPPALDSVALAQETARLARARLLANPKIDEAAFLRLTEEAIGVRAERRLTEAEFRRMAVRPGVVVLDARSRYFFDELHVRGATSLPFTDFTAETLARAIPDPETPILIYCNNNFEGAEAEFATKMPPAALNLSTFVSLFAYGYRNVYELGPLLDIQRTHLVLAGSNSGDYRR